MPIPVIRTRKELINYLSVGCELEQGLCLQYLFTAFSLKDDLSEGGISTQEQLNAVRRWKANLFLIGAQEMLHLAQAANLSASVGGFVQMRRPNFPQAPDYYPTDLPWNLDPFSSEVIQRYACYERPAPGSGPNRMRFDGEPVQPACDCLIQDAIKKPPERALFAHLPASLQAARPARARRAETIGQLYEAIEDAFLILPDVIIGDPDAQIDGRMIDFPQVVKIRSREDAKSAIDLIIRQGEGARGDRPDSHFGVFIDIYNQLAALKRADPSFNPVRPVHPNPLSRVHVDNTYPGWRLIDDPFTHNVNRLCSSIYETMLLMLVRFFATPAPDAAQQRKLSVAFLRVMTTVIKPFGEALTKLPMGPATPGFNAGPSFEKTAAGVSPSGRPKTGSPVCTICEPYSSRSDESEGPATGPPGRSVGIQRKED